MTRKGGVCLIALLVAGSAVAAEEDLWDQRLQQAWKLNEEGNFSAAAAIIRGLAKQADNPAAPVRLATALTSLGMTYHELGQYSDAIRMFRRSLALTEKRHGHVHPDVGLLLANIGATESARGRRSQAEPLLREALKINEVVLDKDDVRLAISRNSYAEVLIHKRRFQEAEKLLGQARASLEKKLGPRHERVAVVINNLAALRQYQNRHAEALALFQESTAMLEERLGPEHPHMLRAMANLGTGYVEMGRFEEAAAAYRRALTIAEKSLGKEHPLYGEVLANYADLLRKTGHKAEYKSVLAQSRAVLRDSARRDGRDATVDVSEMSAFRPTK